MEQRETERGRHSALDLTGKLIAITGGAGALGRAMTATLDAHGAHVIVADVLEPVQGTSIFADLQGVSYFQADAADQVQLCNLLDSIEESHGRLPDVVICHAGIVGTHPVEQYPLDEFDLLMRVNVRGAYVPAREISARWKAGGLPGLLLFTASWVNSVPWPGIAPYSASKAALVQLTKSFARELAPQGIRANAVAPGIVGAGMALHQWETDEDYRKRAGRAIPLGSLQSVQSVADAFLFLCSDLASYMTGSVLLVDGGASLYPMD
jgi:NAD(P)-dependent dehydrogenase (short-subunit alcohol dehydrogenase family)